MNRRHRLTSSTDFKRVRRTGKSYAHPLAVLIADPNALAVTRFGVATAPGMAGAVKRNRAKRRLRAIAGSLVSKVAPGWDLVLVARPGAVEAEWNTLAIAVEDLLKRAGVWEE